MFRKLFVMLTTLGAVALSGCGGGGGSAVAFDAANAPHSLTYDQPSVVYTVNTSIPENTPHSTGGEISDYSVAPSLPAGLNLDPHTGIISGTPQQISDDTSYTVTGSNAAGATSTVLRISVQAQTVAPSSLNYDDPSPSYTVGEAIADNHPNPEGGAVVSYSISQPLPEGLNFSTTTGIISGTPTEISPQQDYTVQGCNSAGCASQTLKITVTAVQQAPTSLSYERPWAAYAKGRAIIANTPIHAGGDIDRYQLAPNSPALPAGLSLDPTSGVIEGTPSATSALTTYSIIGYGGGGSASAQVQIQIVEPGTWVPTPMSMTTARSSFLQLLLPNGKVLVAGGVDASGTTLASAELYDPETGKWSSAGTMTTARTSAVGVVLPNGKVLVAGGRNSGGVLNSAELYDPSNAVTPWQPTGNMPAARENATAVVARSANDNVVVVAAGDNGGSGSTAIYRTTAIYHPTTGTWSDGMQLTRRTTDATAVVLNGGNQVLIPSGREDTTLTIERSQSTTDAQTSAWTTALLPDGARYRYGAIAVTADKALMFGGLNNSRASTATIEMYDATTGSWTNVGNMLSARSLPMVAPLDGDKVLVAGGLAGAANGVGVNAAEVFSLNAGNPTQSTVTAANPMNAVRAGSALTSLPDGNVLASGGIDNTNSTPQYLNSAELYIQ